MSQVTLDAFLAGLDAFEPLQDGYDISLAPSFDAAERAQAEDALIQRAGQGDPRALVTLGRLDASRALPVVRAMTVHQDAWVRLSADRALAALTSGAEGAGLVADARQGASVTRFGAVMELARVAGDDAERALLEALADPDGAIRSRALESLMERHHLEPLVHDPATGSVILEAPLKVIDILLMSELAPLWLQMGWEARGVFVSLAAGVSVDHLGLRYVPSAPAGFRARVRDAFFDEDVPFDVAPIAAVSGHDRRWAESFLALQLDPDVRDERAVRAIADLGARWLVPALSASADGLPPTEPYARAVAAAIGQLGP